MKRVTKKKVCLLGDFGVGKTSLVRRFVEGCFDDKYLSTVGVKISRKSLARADRTLDLIIWDLAGSDEFKRVQTSYLSGASGAMIVCDLTRPETLTSFESYVAQMRETNKHGAIVFVGNKADLPPLISEMELQSVCAKFGSSCLLTSAKTGANVEEAFVRLAEAMEARL